MTSIGTLVAFLIVSIGVMVLRRTAPDLPRGFKVPGYPVTPLLSIAGCIWIIQDLRAVTIYVFFGWSAVALTWYWFYGRQPLQARPRRRGGRERAMTHRRRLQARTGSERASAAPGAHARALARRRPRASAPSCRSRGRRAPRGSTRSTAPTSIASRARRWSEARARLPDDVGGEVARPARALGAGGAARGGRASTSDARSSSAPRRAGGFGHVSLGSAARLLHSSPVPVALAPRGFRCKPGCARRARDRGLRRYRRRGRAGRRCRGRRGARRRVAAARLVRRPSAPAVHGGPRQRGRGGADRAVERGDRGGRRARRSTRCAICRRRRTSSRPSSATARAGTRRSRTSSGTTATCSSSARARSARSRASSSARAPTRSCATRPSRSSLVPRGAAAELARGGGAGSRLTAQRSRSSRRRILPDADFGISSTNSTARMRL